MIALTDSQLKTVMAAAGTIEPSRRQIFLERCAAMLKMRGRFDDSDVTEIVGLALCGLVHRTDEPQRIVVGGMR